MRAVWPNPFPIQSRYTGNSATSYTLNLLFSEYLPIATMATPEYQAAFIANLIQNFSTLEVDAETQEPSNFRVTNWNPGNNYNCLAYAIGVTDRWIGDTSLVALDWTCIYHTKAHFTKKKKKKSLVANTKSITPDNAYRYFQVDPSGHPQAGDVEVGIFLATLQNGVSIANYLGSRILVLMGAMYPYSTCRSTSCRIRIQLHPCMPIGSKPLAGACQKWQTARS